ncbi:hypothetical protein OMP38_14610 [Cohnella ginsengisoli]|uniref:Uncharacterized protein n=1 Tax=Cohnella ginsengisoli TaxID=425004 RepID=A0A9X4KI33_9BACL|nr:hypothetical protein [Cohnella ginsengisoli]MDG0791949.1 hypothetical protein [Cohnella ginsengisoli]
MNWLITLYNDVGVPIAREQYEGKTIDVAFEEFVTHTPWSGEGITVTIQQQVEEAPQS